MAPRYDPVLEPQVGFLAALEPPRLRWRSMKGPLLQMVQPILQIIAASKGIPMNEYLMRPFHAEKHHQIDLHCSSVARIFAFLKQQGAETGLAVPCPQ